MPLPALISPQPIEGIGVTDGNFHGPAVAIFVQDVLGAQGQIGGEKGFNGWGWFSLPRPFGSAWTLTSQHHDQHEVPRQHCVPQATPGLDLGARFAGVRRPTLGGLREGLRRADQVAFFAWGTATLGRRRGRQRVELGADGKTPDHMRRIGQLTDIVLGGIATVRQAPDGPTGHLLGQEIEDSTGQLTARTIRHVEGLGLVGFEGEFEPTRDAEAVTGPPREGNAHDAHHKV